MTNSNQPTPPAPPPGSPVRAEPVPTDIWEPPPPPPKARRPKAPFDRIKLLLVMIIWFGFSLWRLRQSQPALTFSDAVIQQVKDSSWLIVLAGIETIRQIHYYISEKSARYNTFWVRRVWDAIDDWKDRRDPWLRYRMAKYTKWGVAYGLFAFVLEDRRASR